MSFPPAPESFARTQISLHGEAGAAWLNRLPALSRELEGRWSLEVSPQFPNLSYSWVAPAVREGGKPAVLKLSFHEDEGFPTEAKALKAFHGGGICRLLELDSDRGAMLLEHLEPGMPLTAVGDDEEATTIAAGVMKKLWYPAPPDHVLPLVSDWARGFGRLRGRFGGGSGPMPTRLVEEAKRLFDELLASQGEALVLHGNLHQGNILVARRQPWLAIDPKGVVGEATYDTAALLHNPVEALGAPDPGGAHEAAPGHPLRGARPRPRPSLRVGIGAGGTRRLLKPGRRWSGVGRGPVVREAYSRNLTAGGR